MWWYKLLVSRNKESSIMVIIKRAVCRNFRFGFLIGKKNRQENDAKNEGEGNTDWSENAKGLSPGYLRKGKRGETNKGGDGRKEYGAE